MFVLREIEVNELITESDAFTGKEVQVFLSPINSKNTYKQFRLRNAGDNLELYDINIDNPTMQELIIPKDAIKEITYFEGENIYNSVFSIALNHGQIVLVKNQWFVRNVKNY